GKAFENTHLKLIAGEINRVYEDYYPKSGAGYGRMEVAMEADGMAPSFEEKAFHDFHMYTLDQKVSFANNQTKQLELYAPQTIKARAEYEYPVYNNAVKSIIKFTNTAENGAGKPMPKGTIKVYKQDTDTNLEFIGEDRIDHTSRNEEVAINTGNAFDLVASTLVKESKQINNRTTDRLLQITLKNNSASKKTINVIHQLSTNSRILESDRKYTKDTNEKLSFPVEIEPDKQVIFTFKERTEY
ncbi:MAG: DUF4139 domain-containing protein, partial [Candidatus Cloacimonetes bacterium]|nr:DUF4139 domain-containing protein [Candidatus Cloacimonadota bacterium]